MVSDLYVQGFLGPSQVGCDRQISNEPSNIFTFTLPRQLTVSFPTLQGQQPEHFFERRQNPPTISAAQLADPKIT